MITLSSNIVTQLKLIIFGTVAMKKTHFNYLQLGLLCAVMTQPVIAIEKLTDSLDHWQNVYRYGNATQVDDELQLISTGNWFLLSKKTVWRF